MTDRFSSLQGVLWDLDNTLYRLDAALEQQFNLAVAKAALHWGVPLTLPEAMAMAEASFVQHRYSGYEFMVRYQISHDDMHYMTDMFLDDGIVQKCEITRDLFSRTRLNHALITHSARRWALSVIKRLELDPWFPENQIFGYENYNFESKAKSRKPFEMALSALNRNPGDVMMVEDTLENLRVPKEMGMMTVYLHHGRATDKLPPYVDYHTANVIDLLNAVYTVPYSSASG
ncbi:MAG: HAD family hydrolase [Micavibrio sp.]